MGGYLIDTNVISSYFSDKFSTDAAHFITSRINESPYLSIITQIEALSGITPDLTKENFVKMFVREHTILGIDIDIVERCGQLRREARIRTPDAIIAATAMVHDLILITSDRDFDKL